MILISSFIITFFRFKLAIWLIAVFWGLLLKPLLNWSGFFYVLKSVNTLKMLNFSFKVILF